jgi:hypothetical protein
VSPCAAWSNALAAAVALAASACHPSPGAAPPPPGDPMLNSDESMPLPRTFAVELTIAADAEAPGRVHLRVAFHGKQPVQIAIPDRPDQIEWFDPEAKPLLGGTPHIVWTAWRSDNDGIAMGSRPAATDRASRHVTLTPGAAPDVSVDVGAAIDGLFGAGTFRRGWCARAWLAGVAHPVSSNVVCWR